MENENPLKAVENRRENGTFGPGNAANPSGRPKGKTMKEFAREFLMNKTDEEKKKWLAKQTDELVWKMAEGHPHQSSDIDHRGNVTVVQKKHSRKDV